MDELDSAIVRHLQEDARQSNREIAEKVGSRRRHAWSALASCASVG
ncbi:AsnC family transcriptional regulator [Fodinicola feengrottensis]